MNKWFTNLSYVYHRGVYEVMSEHRTILFCLSYPLSNAEVLRTLRVKNIQKVYHTHMSLVWFLRQRLVWLQAFMANIISSRKSFVNYVLNYFPYSSNSTFKVVLSLGNVDIVQCGNLICFRLLQRSRLDSRRYQIFWEVVALERGPLILVSTIEELLERKSSGSGLESREYGHRNPSCWPRGTLYPQKLETTTPKSGGR
jgi:hypothetical protein